MERRRGGVDGWERRRVEQRLHTRVALSDIDNVPMDIIDRTPNELSEIGSQYQCSRWRVRVLDGCDLLIELIDDHLRVQIGEVIDRGNCRLQHLLYADQVREDQVDLIRADAANLTGRCVVEQVRCCQTCCSGRSCCCSVCCGGGWRPAWGAPRGPPRRP